MAEPAHYTPKIGTTIPNFEKPGYIKLPNGEVYKVTVKGYQGNINYNQLTINVGKYLNQYADAQISDSKLEKVVITDNNIACYNPAVTNITTKIAVKTLFGQNDPNNDTDPIPDEEDDLDIIMEEMPEEGPKGLERFKGQTAQQCFEAMGNDARAKLEEAEYIRVGPKRFGVEPGFEALRAWRAEDTARLNDPNDDYYQYLRGAFEYFKKEAVLTEDAFIGILDQTNRKQYGDPLPEKLQNRLKFVYDHIKEQKIDFGKLHQQVLKTSVDDLMSQAAKGEMHQLAKAIVQGTQKEFTKLHFIKLDYDIAGKWYRTFGTVGVPWEKAKAKKIGGVPKTEKIHKMIHWWGTRETRREKNWGAIKETLANDIFDLRQAKGQDLRIVLTKYPDDYPMILLDGEEVQGPNGETYYDFDGHLLGDDEKKRIAVIDKNQLLINQVKVKGEIYHVDMASLATLKMQALFNGDRDKVGSNGGNLGFIINQEGKAVVYNIDPGKSFENVKKISKKFKVNSDCSCVKSHKNFTMFNGALLSDEIEGVKKVLKNHKAVLAKVDEYIRIFGEGELDFRKELKEIRRFLVDQEREIKETFGDRLELSVGELNLLDDFEKQTSPTIKEVKFKERKENGVITPGGTFKLTRPEVIPETRLEWKMRLVDNQYIMTCDQFNEEALATLTNKLGDIGRISHTESTMKVTFPKNKLAACGDKMSVTV